MTSFAESRGTAARTTRRRAERRRTIRAALAAIAVVWACTKDGPTRPTPPPGVAAVVVTPSSASVVVGSTQQFAAATNDAGGVLLTGRAVAWSSSNTSVVTISDPGLALAVSPGTARITATSEGTTGTAAITVTAIAVASVTVTPAAPTVSVGGAQTLTATTKDAAGNTLSGRVVTWTSSNGAVASVTGAGIVTGVAVGTTSITATSEGKAGATVVTVLSSTYAGPFNGQRTVTITAGPNGSCTYTTSLIGTLTMDLQLRADGTMTGTAKMNGIEAQIGAPTAAGVPPPNCPSRFTPADNAPISWNVPVTGTPGRLVFDAQVTVVQGTTTVINTVSFIGSLSSGVVTGSVLYAESGNTIITPTGSATLAVTLSTGAAPVPDGACAVLATGLPIGTAPEVPAGQIDVVGTVVYLLGTTSAGESWISIPATGGQPTVLVPSIVTKVSDWSVTSGGIVWAENVAGGPLGQHSEIKTTSLAGGTVSTIATTRGPNAMLYVFGNAIYWPDSTYYFLNRYDRGSQTMQQFGPVCAQSVCPSANRTPFWQNIGAVWGDDQFSYGKNTNNTGQNNDIVRVRLSSSVSETVLSIPLPGPGVHTGVVRGGTTLGDIYVSSCTDIPKSCTWSRLVAPNQATPIVTLPSSGPIFLDTNGGFAYFFAQASTPTYPQTGVYRVPIVGGTPSLVIANCGFRNVVGFAVDGATLYITENGGNSGASDGRLLSVRKPAP